MSFALPFFADAEPSSVEASRLTQKFRQEAYMECPLHKESREPDGAASLPQKTNPANAGCFRREPVLWVGGRGSVRAVDSIFISRGAPPAGMAI